MTGGQGNPAVLLGPGTCTVDAIPVAELARWVRDSIPQLLELTELEQNWDSYGSPPPSVDLVRAIIQLLHYCEVVELAAPTIVPMCGGGIQLEWVVKDCELEVAFYPDGRVTSLTTRASGEVLGEEEFSVSDFAMARRAIRWVRRGR